MFDLIFTMFIVLPYFIILSILGLAGIYLMTIFPIQLIYKSLKD